ncbi:acyl-CoA dehydrogenase [Blastomyces gilchristii SLH14081]|uniref:Acyl-CoA dehydrogenase n=1 Tax=Blastomyces gilchristii (strain SLH14081) TaxID=559298 RepID=A0A179UDK4_BLAGS|nr:acyl-CoA dehydrogenase [Blastomyces gilchristii SLH14081]OAT05920.1 acyl-CoA dehydrogenase [Blastomyces gilchristii SLH14081]
MASALLGSTAPYVEPFWHSRDTSPYYNESHRNLRLFVRDYVENHLRPYADEYEKQGFIPPEALKLYVEKGFTIIKPTKREYMGGLSLPAGIEPEEWDIFHNLVVADELNRVGYTGVLWGLFGGNNIGCPPILDFGNEAQKLEYLPKISRGEIRFCLGITEPDAGSDVANIRTTAIRRGNKYIVNGAKKWITNGIWADYCTAAVRTGGEGRRGISLLIIPLAAKGVTRRIMENSGVNASGSTFIEFDDVEVPVENLIGTENDGFRYIMSNFNPERLGLAISCIRLSRVCVEDAYNYATNRETFGQPLITNQIIRAKFSKLGRLIEPCQAFLEQLAYTIHVATKNGQEVNVGGMTALLKVMSTRCLEKVCREAQQVLGGAGYNKSGRGARIEQISRDVRVYVVGGGSEEILSDLAVREEIKSLYHAQRTAKKEGAKI